MTIRTAALGVLALFVGVATMWISDGGVVTVIGATLAIGGLVIATAAGLLGVDSADPVRRQTAEHAKDVANAAEVKTASETGRWPRVIGGG